MGIIEFTFRHEFVRGNEFAQTLPQVAEAFETRDHLVACARPVPGL
ncbi:hypothetical protein [Amycolatopsis sulphurea]|nr:hypothetical protein [Amycolatopsis sulphurea]